MDKKWYIIACLLIALTIAGAVHTQRHTITVTPRDTENSSPVNTIPPADSQSEADTLPPDTATDEIYYILNTNSKKFHYPTCTSVERMKEENRAESTVSREQLIADGYTPCGNCDP